MPSPAPEERAAADEAQETRRAQRAIGPATEAAPVGPATDGPALSREEFRALFDNRDTLQAAQQQITKVEAALRRRLEQAAAALATPVPDGPENPRIHRPSASQAVHHAARQTQAPTTPPVPGPRP